MRHGNWKAALWDWRYGVDTRGVEPTPAPHGVQYEPTSPGQFRRLMNLLPHSPEGRTFIDFGSGKGRVLLLALAYPFQRVIGIEYSAKFHRVAERNLRSYRGRRQCKDACLFHGDARDFELAPGPLTLYFHNPFDRDVMEPVVANVKRSIEAAPREVSILCLTKWTETTIIERIPGLRTVVKSMDDAVYHVA